MRNQGCIQYVYPALAEGKRILFVMVDALRYEMGKTFAHSVERSFRDRVNITPHLSYPIPVTRFGMANHLSDISICEKDGKLQPAIGDEIISSASERINYLKSKTQVEVMDTRLEDFDASMVTDSVRLLVARSTGIDTAGENDKLNGLATMEREIIRLSKLMEDCRRLKFDLAVLVADHGFMIQPSFRAGDLIDKPVGSDVILEESRLLVGNINDSANTLSFTPADLGVNANVMKLCYAKNYTVFRRGEVYFHEGLSPQENIVPIITIRLQEEKKRQTFKIDLLYKGKQEGTAYSRRPIVDINTFFPDLFSDDVNIRLVIQDESGSIIGRPEGKFYNDITEMIDIPAGATQIRQPISIDDEYHGNGIVITALHPETNATMSTLRLNFEND